MTGMGIHSQQGTTAGACSGVPGDHQQAAADGLKVWPLEKSRRREDSRRAPSLYKDIMMTLTGIHGHHKRSVRACWKVPGTSQQAAADGLKVWPLENYRACPDSPWAAARYKDRMMIRTRIGWGIAEGQRRIVNNTALLELGVSGQSLNTNQNHRRTSVLKGDGATRADSVTAAIRRGAPMIDDG